MIILIAGDTHTGKTLLAQKLLERLGYPYLSIDHLKMGLIRSNQTDLIPTSGDKELTEYLWPIVREMIKTNIENKQNLIVEGCYIPFDFADSFTEGYLREIQYICLAFTARYIDEHSEDICANESVIEKRIASSDYTVDDMKAANAHNEAMCQQHGLKCILVDDNYDTDRMADEAAIVLRES
ncbi:MAG: adenylate kinase [Clostridiales bacterium]|nr:adenylate kinase [Clostridiales bacterium]